MAGCRATRVVNRRGLATVELAIVAPVLLVLLFAIIEFGLLFGAVSELNTVARIAARAAAAGESEERILERLCAVSGAIPPGDMTLTLEYREYIADGVWDDTWYPVQSYGDNNMVPPGSLIRATVEYDYKLLVPGLFPFLVDDQEAGTKHLSASVTMPRT